MDERTTATARCFGGPWDGMEQPATHAVLMCLVPKAGADIEWASDDPRVWLDDPYVRRTYTSQRLRFAHMEWTVFLYDGPWVTITTAKSPAEYVQQAMQLMWEIARLWNGQRAA